MVRNFIIAAVALAAGIPALAQKDPVFSTDAKPTVLVSEEHEKMMTGKFEPTYASLSQYELPEWFRNAKFGIWAHWGPQCVEGSGDWMARGMYSEGSSAYNYHVEHYGHPSEVGFKDILPLFKAERWNPDSLVAYYKSLGAQYFFAMGNHHDNFDLWDSKYQEWNSKRIGPKRDVLGEWAAAARKNGLKFGVSIHADRAWRFYETAQRYDRSGKYMGVPYDGNMTKADGKGKWWEGMDPQNLYAQRHPLSQGSWADGMIGRQWNWGNGCSLPTAGYCTNFYDRTLDVINRYSPDLLYFDTTVLPLYPFSDAGLKIAAHYYNHSAAQNKGKESCVMFGKILPDAWKEALVWDVEKGSPDKIQEKPWQSCSCIGGWHYSTDIYKNDRYKSAATVVRLLVDIVSKNGSLLLSVPLRSDGTFDEKEKAILDEFGAWMRVNKESIIGTRPWKVFGEGPIAGSTVKMRDQGFNEGSYSKATAAEIRFTQTPRCIYATALGWPTERKLTIHTLAKGNPYYGKSIGSVTLLGYGKVKSRQTSEGLEITLPEQDTNTIAPVFKIKK